MLKKAESDLDDLYEIIETVKSHDRRSSLCKLFKTLEKEGDLRSLPASCYLHGSYERLGFVDHTIRVCKLALKLGATLEHEVSRDSLITCALLHDLSKAGLLVRGGVIPRYIRNKAYDSYKPKTRWNKPWNYNPAQPPWKLPLSSVVMATRFIGDLTIDETMAIAAADGQYVGENRWAAHHESALMLIVTMADTWAGYIETKDERQEFNSDDDILGFPHTEKRDVVDGDITTEAEA